MLKSVDDSRFADYKRGQTKCNQNANEDVTAGQSSYTFIANAVVHIGAKIAEPVTIFASYHQFFGEKNDFIYSMMTSSTFLQKMLQKGV